MASHPLVKHSYRFGPFEVDTVERILFRNQEALPLTPKVFDILLLLVENGGHVVEKERLMQAIWPDSFVEEGNLTQNISMLRKALGDGENGHQYIQTIARRGYRFVGTVNRPRDPSADLIVEKHSQLSLVVEREKETSPAVSDSRMTDLNFVASRAVIGSQSRLAGSEDTILSEVPQASSRRLKGRMSAGLIALGIAVALAAFAFLFLLDGTRHGRSRLGALSRNRTATKLTRSGKSSLARISPDGKYVAYVVSDHGQQSIWLRQVGTSSNVPVIAPADVDYGGLAFSPDSNYIYYSAQENGKRVHSLYQVAALGGTPKRILDDVSSSISFSPNGMSFAFILNNPPHSGLFVRRTDGSAEREIAEPNIPYRDRFIEPSWSPDGDLIACSLLSPEGGWHMEVTCVPARGGPQKPVPTKVWAWINGLQWAPDGSGLLVSTAERSAAVAGSQIWRISYPGGEVRPVTGDFNNYAGISIASDSSSLVTVDYETSSNIWLVPVVGTGDARPLTSGSGKYREATCVGDGRIVYTSDAGWASRDVWIMDADGKKQKQLTSDSGINAHPCISPDRRYIAFTSSRGRALGACNIWRMDIDGSNPTRLTTDERDYSPAFSLDGKWVYYTRETPDPRYHERPRIWRVPVDGGEPQLLIDGYSYTPQISPDGKLLACEYNLQKELGIFSTEGGPGPPLTTVSILRSFNAGWGQFRGSGQFRWAPDGKSIIYLQWAAGVSNLWRQPLDGGRPTQLTDFTWDLILDFDVIGDGKQFACSRGTVVSDVILIKDTGNP